MFGKHEKQLCRVVDRFYSQNDYGYKIYYYKIALLDSKGRTVIRNKKPDERIMDFDYVVDRVQNNLITLVNPDIMAEDARIQEDRYKDPDQKELEQYNKLRVKSELLGVDFTDIEVKMGEYILKKLVPDKNGVAVIPDFITEIADTCYSLNKKYNYTKIIWRNPRVFDIQNLFKNNLNITSIDLSECNISRIPGLHGLFQSCKNLKYVNFGDNDFSNVADISMLLADTSLSNINLQKVNLNRCYNMSCAFTHCKNLSYLDMSQCSIIGRYSDELLLSSGDMPITPDITIKFKGIDLGQLVQEIRAIDKYNLKVHKKFHFYVDSISGWSRFKRELRMNPLKFIDTLNTLVVCYDKNAINYRISPSISDYLDYIGNCKLNHRFLIAGYNGCVLAVVDFNNLLE